MANQFGPRLIEGPRHSSSAASAADPPEADGERRRRYKRAETARRHRESKRYVDDLVQRLAKPDHQEHGGDAGGEADQPPRHGVADRRQPPIRPCRGEQATRNAVQNRHAGYVEGECVEHRLNAQACEPRSVKSKYDEIDEGAWRNGDDDSDPPCAKYFLEAARLFDRFTSRENAQ